MTFRQLQLAFETEALQFVNTSEKPYSKEIEFWLNLGLSRFIRHRYTGNNLKQTGFEQTQERIDDLRTLVKTKKYIPNEELSLPKDYMFLLRDTASIVPIDESYECWDKDKFTDKFIPKQFSTIEATLEDIDYRLQNPLSEHRLHNDKARPLRLIRDSKVYLYTDDTYKITEYDVYYLRHPEKIDIHTNPTLEYTDMPEHTHNDIIKTAVGLFLENKSNPRYQSQPYEIAAMT